MQAQMNIRFACFYVFIRESYPSIKHKHVCAYHIIILIVLTDRYTLDLLLTAQYQSKYYSQNYSPDVGFGSEDATLDPEYSVFKETAMFFDIWEDAFIRVSSGHFLFLRIPIKAVVPEREFLMSTLVSCWSFSESTSAKENTGISGLASVQMLGIGLFSSLSRGKGIRHSALGNFGEAS